VAKSDSPAIAQATKEAREGLDNADMDLFDRYMKWLVNVPKSAVDSKEKKNRLSKLD
jgi:hypothetical protein